MVFLIRIMITAKKMISAGIKPISNVGNVSTAKNDT